MMTHIEYVCRLLRIPEYRICANGRATCVGRSPIVQGFYEITLLSWYKALMPPLPLLSNSPLPPTSYLFGEENKYIRVKDIKEMGAELGAYLGIGAGMNECKRIVFVLY
jgi:hypothetical protein